MQALTLTEVGGPDRLVLQVDGGERIDLVGGTPI